MCRALAAAAGTRATATTARPTDPATGAFRDIPCPAEVAPKKVQGPPVPTIASARAGTAVGGAAYQAHTPRRVRHVGPMGVARTARRVIPSQATSATPAKRAPGPPAPPAATV